MTYLIKNVKILIIIFIFNLSFCYSNEIHKNCLDILKNCYKLFETPTNEDLYNSLQIIGYTNNKTNFTNFKVVFSKNKTIYKDSVIEIYQNKENRITLFHDLKEIQEDSLNNFNEAMNLFNNFKQDSTLNNLVIIDSTYKNKDLLLVCKLSKISSINVTHIIIRYVIDLEKQQFKLLEIVDNLKNMTLIHYQFYNVLLGQTQENLLKIYPELLYLDDKAKLYESHSNYIKK